MPVAMSQPTALSQLMMEIQLVMMMSWPGVRQIQSLLRERARLLGLLSQAALSLQGWLLEIALQRCQWRRGW